jgi:uncharacterized protein YodC (DUF2158 family)
MADGTGYGADNTSFAEGDIVRLKTGSPMMAVEKYGDARLVSTVWFDESEVRRDCFHPDALILVKKRHG